MPVPGSCPLGLSHTGHPSSCQQKNGLFVFLFGLFFFWFVLFCLVLFFVWFVFFFGLFCFVWFCFFVVLLVLFVWFCFVLFVLFCFVLFCFAFCLFCLGCFVVLPIVRWTQFQVDGKSLSFPFLLFCWRRASPKMVLPIFGPTGELGSRAGIITIFFTWTPSILKIRRSLRA